MVSSPYLIVDDSPDDLFLIDRMLADNGMGTEHAKSVAEAIEKLSAKSYELVFLDLQLPDANGLDHVKLVHETYPDMPIVVLSGIEDEDVTKECLHLGVQDYLPKSLISPVLLQRIANHAIERKVIEQRIRESDREMKRLLSEAEMHNRQLAEISKTDELTALPNRMHFQETLHQRVLSAERAKKGLGVLYFDLNGFKIINDTFGHAAGDQVLVQVATRLRDGLRKSDFIARVGGDEFLVLTDLLEDPVQSYSVAKKISMILEQPIDVKGHEVYVSASVGIATYPEVTTGSELIDCADKAMYEAKHNRSHFACFYSKRLQTEFAEKRRMETALKHVIENNQLSAQFQQIVGHQQGVTGLEVFCRWNHPELGTITPSTFIPMAESMNSSDQISAQMLAVVAAASRKFFANSKNFFSLNLTAKQIRSAEFAEQIAKVAESLDFPPTRLCFEFTEQDIETGDVPYLRNLKSAGFKLALSNFGSGPTSMKLIPELPLDFVKLDRELVGMIFHSPVHNTICDNIIRLCHSLNIQVVAEGVETEAEKLTLQQLGCDQYQGFFMGAPFSLPL